MSKCLIDNWTLELAGLLLDEGLSGIRRERLSRYHSALESSMVAGVDQTGEVLEDWTDFDDYFSALANFLSAMLVFEDLHFAKNGFESAWKRFPAFSQAMEGILKAREQPETITRIERRADLRRMDSGALFYLALSSSLDCDLLLSPRRSTALEKSQGRKSPSYGEYADDLLVTLDHKISERINTSRSDLLRATVIPDLQFPALATLVLSQAHSHSEILTAARDLRNSRELRDLRSVISDCVAEIKSGLPYARLIDTVPDAVRLALNDAGRLDSDGGSLSVGFSILFFSIEKEVGKIIPPYLLFLRDLAKCRLEFEGFASHIERLFEPK